MSPRQTALPRSVDVVIIGGGIAGLAAAAELAARRPGRILLLEQEAAPGRHSTARNASLLLSHTVDPVAAQVAMASRPFYADTADDEPARFRPVGSLLVYSGADAEARAHARIAGVAPLGLEAAYLTPEEARARVPVLNAERLGAAAFTPADGVIEIAATVDALTDRAVRGGVLLMCGVRAIKVTTEEGRVSGVVTSAGQVSAGTVVIAAGWAAGALGTGVGAPLPLRVTRRHLAVTEPWEPVDPAWPFVWDLDADFYFRPEAGGLLLCPCDVVDAPDASVEVDEATIARTREMAGRLVSGAAELPLARAWAGLRTMTPDDRFIIGPDPRVGGLAWLAGLGGHGMAGGPAAGIILAQRLAGEPVTIVDPALVGVERFLAG
jgi:glycine/D-amino acid oxidase-like deaminating enzyme